MEAPKLLRTVFQLGRSIFVYLCARYSIDEIFPTARAWLVASITDELMHAAGCIAEKRFRGLENVAVESP
jgi:hypothetical protein